MHTSLGISPVAICVTHTPQNCAKHTHCQVFLPKHPVDTCTFHISSHLHTACNAHDLERGEDGRCFVCMPVLPLLLVCYFASVQMYAEELNGKQESCWEAMTSSFSKGIAKKSTFSFFIASGHLLETCKRYATISPYPKSKSMLLCCFSTAGNKLGQDHAP